jgi:pimeloyl-ACP methyl ester carboxylesterase
MPGLPKRLLLGALVVLLPYVGVCAYIWETQRQHIFKASAQLEAAPDRKGMTFEEVHIPVGSGSDRGALYGWWIPAAHSTAPTLLYLHGNGDNIGGEGNLDSAGWMHRMGYNVLMVDYRGYGKSTGGEPSEAKVYEDAEAAWEYLIRQRGCAPPRTFIYGYSLGGAVAIELAIHHPEAAGLIVESTFTTMSAMGKLAYGYLPVDLLLNQYFDSVDKVGKLKIPASFIHGMKDRRVPYQMSQQLFERTPQPKYLTLIEGGGHGNGSAIGGAAYRESFTAFVRKYAH